MKKTTLSIFIGLLSFIVQAQEPYSHYLDETSEWRTRSWGWIGVSVNSYSTFYFDGTAVFNGIAYYKEYAVGVQVISYNPPQIEVFPPTLNSYTREDVSGKFYRYNPETDEETEVFDNQPIANAEVGSPFPNANCTVNIVEIIDLAGLPLKWIKPDNYYPGTLEGIGVLGLNCAWSEYISWINCYTKQGQTLQFNDDTACDAFPVPLRVNLSSDSIAENNLVIYPNPASGSFKIQTSVSGNLKVSLINTYGRVVAQKNLQDNREMDISALSSGIYYVKIEDGSKQVVKKLVKL